MDAYTFWNVIGNYNEYTLIIQIILLVFVLTALVLSYSKKTNWAAKFALGIVNLYIGIAFFALFGTEPIQFFSPCHCFCFVESCFYMRLVTIMMIFSKFPTYYKWHYCHCMDYILWFL